MSRLPLMRWFSRSWINCDIEYPAMVNELCRRGAGVAGLLLLPSHPVSGQSYRVEYTTVTDGVGASIIGGGRASSCRLSPMICQREYHAQSQPWSQALRTHIVTPTIHHRDHHDQVTALLSPGCRPDSSQARGMAGHSKWANIRHVKELKDAQKATVAQKMTNRLRLAIKEGGGTDPKFNYQLARVIAQASAADIPKSTIDTTLKNIEKSAVEGSQVQFEAKGPGGCWIIIEAFTDRPRHTRTDIYTLFKKLGGQLGDRAGFASHAFDYKGVIHVTPGGSIRNLDEAEEAAINAEAEEVKEIQTEDGHVFQLICDPKEVYAVRKRLLVQAPDAEIDMCRFVYFPNTYCLLSEQVLEVAVKVLDGLEGLPDVMQVWSNIKPEGED